MKRFFIPVILIMAAMLNTSCYDQEPQTTGYYGADILTDFKLMRNKFDKKTVFKSESKTEWALYAGRSVEGINMRKPIARGEGFAAVEIEVPDSVRYYYQIVTPDGGAILSEKVLPMKGAYNVRDMGGIRTAEGRYVKWGLLFRSDELNDLTSDDLRYLSNIPLKTIVDFRSAEEICRNPDNIPSSVENVYKLMISPGNLSGIANSLESVSSPMIDKMMSELNELLVGDSTVVEMYRRFFELLQNPAEDPLLFHCTAGKDRTGMAAALFLFSVGADRETVMGDYLLSNKFLDGKFGEYKKRYPDLADLFGVKESFLGAGLDKIDEIYGSVENFLTGPLEVDLALMREIYLY